METIVSTISNTSAPREAVAGGLLAMAAPAVRRWWHAYIAWRVQGAVIAHLKSMSDRDLKDIGLSRSQIDASVRGRIDLDGDRPLLARSEHARLKKARNRMTANTMYPPRAACRGRVIPLHCLGAGASSGPASE